MNADDSLDKKFKSLVKKRAQEKRVAPQQVAQKFFVERLLERISSSPHKRKFIVKGGFLISLVVGIDKRTTMDLDVTAKGFSLDREELEKILTEVCSVDVNDGVSLEINKISEIRKNDDYPGLRAALTAKYLNFKTPLTVDVTTGDAITPKEIERKDVELLFLERRIDFWAYNLETILAEKIETILSRGVSNTRARDFYDVYALQTLSAETFDVKTLRNALERTSTKRGSRAAVAEYESSLETILKSDGIKQRWSVYQNQFEYARGISFDDVYASLCRLVRETLGD